MRRLHFLALITLAVAWAIGLAGCGGSTGTASAPGPIDNRSATGARIVYSNGSDVCTMNPDGSGSTNLTAGWGYFCDWPTWSPNGAKIAFRRWVGSPAANDYYIMRADGAQRTRVTHHPAWRLGDYASWSPDGTKLAFPAADPNDGGVWHLYIINTDGSGLTKRTSLGAGGSASWSPDGTRIALCSFATSPPQIWTVKPNGSGLKRLTHYNGFDLNPRWSQDGTKIVFTRDFGSDRNICVMNPDGSQIHRLTNSSDNQTFPTWSPNGANIAFWGPSGIYVMKANGTGAKLVMTGGQTPSWQRQG